MEGCVKKRTFDSANGIQKRAKGAMNGKLLEQSRVLQAGMSCVRTAFFSTDKASAHTMAIIVNAL